MIEAPEKKEEPVAEEEKPEPSKAEVKAPVVEEKKPEPPKAEVKPPPAPPAPEKKAPEPVAEVKKPAAPAKVEKWPAKEKATPPPPPKISLEEEAIALATMGFVPGFLVSTALYKMTENAIDLPLELSLGRAVFVFTLTLVMCGISGAIATRRLANAQPAELF